MFPPPGFRA